MIMTTVRARPSTHEIAGQLVEICACPLVCPCWAGPAPEVTRCGSVVVWCVDRGVVDGVDVSGRVIAASVHPAAGRPGAQSPGGWRTEVIVDERCTPMQGAALLRAFTRALGCALAEMALDQPDHRRAHSRHRALHRTHRQPAGSVTGATGPTSGRRELAAGGEIGRHDRADREPLPMRPATGSGDAAGSNAGSTG